MKEFKCQVCDKAFRYLSLYERHKRVHSEFKNFKCDICQKSFNRPDTLKTHKNIHFKTGFACCNRFFHSKAALKYHQKANHSVKTQVFQCKQCKNTFDNQQFLKLHQQTHIVNEFPMILDCICTEQSNVEIQPNDRLVLVVDDGCIKHSIWSEADMLLSFIKV